MADRCVHPYRAVFWNPGNDCVQCHVCGEDMLEGRKIRGLREAVADIGPFYIVEVSADRLHWMPVQITSEPKDFAVAHFIRLARTTPERT